MAGRPPPIPSRHRGEFISNKLGEVTQEIFETQIRRALEANPGRFAKMLGPLKDMPEIFEKTAGIFTAGAAGLLAAALFAKLGIPSGVARLIGQSLDEAISGAISAFAEAAHRGRVIPTTAMPVLLADSMNVAFTPADPTHFHAFSSTNKTLVLCATFFALKTKWDARQLEASAQRGGRKDGGQKGGGKFPVETFDIKEAEQIGLVECPNCAPKTKAAQAAAEPEASVADNMHAAGHQAEAKEEGRERLDTTKLTARGRYLIVALTASVPREEADLVNEVMFADPILIEEVAARVTYREAVAAGIQMQAGDIPDDGIVAALPDVLMAQNVELCIRFLFGTGVGQVNSATRVEDILHRIFNRKEEKERSENLFRAVERVAELEGDVDDLNRNIGEIDIARKDYKDAKEALDALTAAGASTAQASARLTRAQAALDALTPNEGQFRADLRAAKTELARAKGEKEALTPRPPKLWHRVKMIIGTTGALVAVGIVLAALALWGIFHWAASMLADLHKF